MPKLPPVSVRRFPVSIRVGEILVRYGLVICRRMALLVPWDVLTVRSPGGVLAGTRNRILLLDQEVNAEEGITTEPIRTELLPRDEPKLLPLTVTTVFVRTVCGETLLMRGEVLAETRIIGNTSLPYPLSLSLPRGPMSTVAATRAFHNCLREYDGLADLIRAAAPATWGAAAEVPK